MSKIIAIDFDGTLCRNAFPNIGEPKMDVIRAAKVEASKGTRLILWTCRTGELLEAALRWCYELGLEFDAVNENLPETLEHFGSDCRKVFANEYWDDRAVNPDPINGLTCRNHKHTQGIKQRPFPWCSNSCKNFKPKGDFSND